MVESFTSRFQMVGARSAILEGPITEPIEQQIEAIENTLESIPDFAFDLSKTLVESVCKTILADIGQPADRKWDAPKLLKETTNHLNLLPRNHPNPANARDSVEKTIRGMLQTIQGLCELRRELWYGFPWSRRLFRTTGPSASNAGCSGSRYYRFVPLPHPSRRTQAVACSTRLLTRTTPISTKRLTATMS